MFAIMLQISSEEQIISIQVGLDDAESIIDAIDKRYALGISEKVSDSLIKSIDQSNPFIASLMQ